MVNTLLFITYLIPVFVHWETDVWLSKIFVGLLLSTLWLTYIIHKRIHWSLALAFLWTVTSGMSVSTFPVIRYDIPGATSFDAQAANSLFYTLLMILPFLFLRFKNVKPILSAISFAVIADSCFVLYQLYQGYPAYMRGSFFGNSSINACLLAFCYPFVAFRPSVDRPASPTLIDNKFFFCKLIVLISLPILAIFVSGSSVAIGVLAVVVMTELFFRGYKKLAAAGFISPFIVAYFVQGKDLFVDSDRFGVWSLVMRYWWNPHLIALPTGYVIQPWEGTNHWIGTGLGSYFLFAGHIQTIAHFHLNNWWIWLHNDFLQLLFEQGFIGLAIYLNLAAFCIYQCIKNKNSWLLASIAGYMATCAANFPSHLFYHGLIGVTICVLSLKYSKKLA